MTGRLDLGSRILPYTCNEISRRCQKKEDFPGRILTCDNAIKRQKTGLDFIQTASIGLRHTWADLFCLKTNSLLHSFAVIQPRAPQFYACGIRGNSSGR